MDQSRIRNFCIVAHIDHGKSTLADRLLELTKTVEAREMTSTYLDGMDLERERGITIKAKAVCMAYVLDGVDYELNLIDTPGHVDFNYEVSRSLSACEGAVLLVDCSQGVEAQTVANAYLAVNAGLEIVPALNKTDLPHARVEESITEIENSLGLDTEGIHKVSAKSGMGVQALLEDVIRRVPPPKGDPNAPLRALVFDSLYDDFRGVVIYVRVKDGAIKRRDRVQMHATGGQYEVLECGVLRPRMQPRDELTTGEVGYLVCNIKTLADVKIGDTVYHQKTTVKPLPGFKEPKPMVYSGLYPTATKDFEALRDALAKLALNDSSLTYVADSSEALGFGFRCGFLGMLHLEIVQERLEREDDLDLVQTAPNVGYEAVMAGGEVIRVERPSMMPDPGVMQEIREPIARMQLIVPGDSLGTLMKLCSDRRATFISQEYLSPTRVMLTYDIPLAEIIFDFYDRLKSATRGYGTIDYEVTGYRAADLVRMRILVGGHEVDALSMICHRSQAEYRGRKVIEKLRKEIPRHMFEVPLQAAVGGKIIARETIKALRKNVLAKCYGGDISRKRKLLEKQKEGKKRMKNVGNVEIPQAAFLAVLSATDE